MVKNPYAGLYSSQGKWRKPPETPMDVITCFAFCFASNIPEATELIKSTEGKSIVLHGREQRWPAYKIAEELYLLQERNKNGKS